MCARYQLVQSREAMNDGEEADWGPDDEVVLEGLQLLVTQDHLLSIFWNAPSSAKLVLDLHADLPGDVGVCPTGAKCAAHSLSLLGAGIPASMALSSRSCASFKVTGLGLVLKVWWPSLKSGPESPTHERRTKLLPCQRPPLTGHPPSRKRIGKAGTLPRNLGQ